MVMVAIDDGQGTSVPPYHVAEEGKQVVVTEELEHALVAPGLPVQQQLREGPHRLHLWVLPSCLTPAFRLSRRHEIAEHFPPSEGVWFSA